MASPSDMLEPYLEDRLSLIEIRLDIFEARQKNSRAEHYFSRVQPVQRVSGGKVYPPPSCYPLTVENFWDLQDLEHRHKLCELIKFYEILPVEAFPSTSDFIDNNVEEAHSILAGELNLDYGAIRARVKIETKNREVALLLNMMKEQKKRRAEEVSSPEGNSDKRKKTKSSPPRRTGSPIEWFPPRPSPSDRKAYREWQKKMKNLGWEPSQYFPSSENSLPSRVVWDNTVRTSPRAQSSIRSSQKSLPIRSPTEHEIVGTPTQRIPRSSDTSDTDSP